MRITRSEYHRMINAGMNTGELFFVERLAKQWLLEYPGDIQAKLHLAKIALLGDDPKLSANYLTQILLKDPEDLGAYELLIKNPELKDRKAVASFIHVISGRTDDISAIFPWAVTLRAVRNGIRRGELKNA